MFKIKKHIIIAGLLLSVAAAASEPQWRFRAVEPQFVDTNSSYDYGVAIAPNGDIVSATMTNDNNLIVNRFAIGADAPQRLSSMTGSTRQTVLRTLATANGQLLYNSKGMMFTSLTGEVVWERNGYLNDPILLDDGSLVFGAGGGRVVCLRVSDGNTRWIKNVVSLFPNAQAYGNTTVASDGTDIFTLTPITFGGGSDFLGVLTKLSLSDGAAAWATVGPRKIGYTLLANHTNVSIVNFEDSDTRRLLSYSKLDGTLLTSLDIGVQENFMDLKVFEPAPNAFVMVESKSQFPYDTRMTGFVAGVNVWRKDLVSRYGYKRLLDINAQEFVTLEYGYNAFGAPKIEKRRVADGGLVWSAPLFADYPYSYFDMPVLISGNSLRVATDWGAGFPNGLGTIVADFDLQTGAEIKRRVVMRKRITKPETRYGSNDTLLFGAAVDETQGKMVVRAVNKISGVAAWSAQWPVPTGTSAFRIVANGAHIAIGESSGDQNSQITVLNVTNGQRLFSTERSYAKQDAFSLGLQGLIQTVTLCETCVSQSRYVNLMGTTVWTGQAAFVGEALNGAFIGAASRNELRAIDETTGALRWSTQTGSASYMYQQVLNGELYAIASPARLLKIDVNTGAILWSRVFNPLGSNSNWLRELSRTPTGGIWVSNSYQYVTTVYLLNPQTGAIEQQFTHTGEQTNLTVNALTPTGMQINQGMRRRYDSFDSPDIALGVLKLNPLTAQVIGEHVLGGRRPLSWQRENADRNIIGNVGNSVLQLQQGEVQKFDLGPISAPGDVALSVLRAGFSAVFGMDAVVLKIENRSDLPAQNVRLFSEQFGFVEQIVACEQSAAMPCGITLPKTAEVRFNLPARSWIQFTVANQNVNGDLGYKFNYAIEPDTNYLDKTVLDNRVEAEIYSLKFQNGFE